MVIYVGEISYKNRGMFLENIINESNTYYNSIDKSLLYIIADVAGIISIFFGIMIYNSQKGYNPTDDINVNINNRMPINNRVDLSTENLKRQNNDVIFSKK